ncbi:hypothetical protein ATANTOWER_023158, partial [Ataeniobius toweri]|nr:hypothetical protein [Ataeniobius toweri]
PAARCLTSILGKSNLQFAGMTISLTISTSSLNLLASDCKQVRLNRLTGDCVLFFKKSVGRLIPKNTDEFSNEVHVKCSESLCPQCHFWHLSVFLQLVSSPSLTQGMPQE